MFFKIFFIVLSILVSVFSTEIKIETEDEPLPGTKLSKFYNCKEFESDLNYMGKLCTIENYERRYDILPVGTSQIKEVDFINSELFDIPNTIFKIFPKLKYVNMTNSLVKRLSDKSFIQADYLEWLILDDNEIQEIPADVFKSTPKLEYAYLRRNQIKSVDKDAFKDASNLKLIYLSSNKIEIIDVETFNGLEKLSLVSLANNKLKSIDMKIFYKNPVISGIFFNNNTLENLTLKFRHNSLESINVDDNQLTTLKLYADEASSTKTYLSITANNNKLTSLNGISDKFKINSLRIANNSLQDFTAILSRSTISILDLSYNDVGPILTNTFQALTKLNDLQLTGANITDISPDAFSSNPHLWTLNVSRNNLKINDVNMFESATELRSLDISGNVIDSGLNVNEFKRLLKHLERIDLMLAQD